MAVEIRLSGGQNNSSPNGSIGGQRSDTAMTTDTVENLFDNITRSEALQGRTEHRCIYVYNTGAGHISGATIEVTVNPTISIVSLGLDAAGKGDGRNTGIAQTIATEDTAPSNIKFFGEDTLSTDGPHDTVKLPLGLLKSGEGVPVWLKRVTEKGASQTISVTIVIEHDAVTLPGETFDDGGAVGEFFSVTTQTTGTFIIGTATIGFSDIGSP